MASQPRVSATEPPVPCHSGTLTSDATIAPADSAVMYMPMRKPARSGQRRLIRLDSRTFITAIALLSRIVPGKSSARGATPRATRPAVSAIIAPSRTRSSPARLARAAAKPETTPKQITGVAASSETVALDRPRLSCSSGKIGGRLVIAPRRLKPSASTPTTSRVRSSRTFCWPAADGGDWVRLTSN